VPAEASDALRSQLHQLEDQIAQFGPLLPEAPIGAGARWRVTTDTAATTFTVTELDDEVLRYTTEVTVTDGSSQLAGTGSGTMALRTIAPQWTTELDGSIDPGQDLTIRSAAEPSEPR
jgi:hypothetical protein